MLAVFSMVFAGCLGGGSGPRPAAESAGAPTRGGELEVFVPGGFDTIDMASGAAVVNNLLLTSVHRTLYSWRPESGLALRPDLATGPPEISADKRTITVRIRGGVRFSPPVHREVVAGDVKYGVERLFTKGVLSPFAPLLFGDLEGVAAFRSGAAADISGIRVPDDRTVVFRLTQPTAGTFAELSLQLTPPTPKEYAQRFDRRTPSTYGRHQVVTGPYMFEADDRGLVTDEGYRPGVGARLVRNPNWDAATDDRPAYLDAIRFKLGFDDAALATRLVLKGPARSTAAFPPPPQMFAKRDQRDRDQLLSEGLFAQQLSLALNTARPPFHDRAVRLAAMHAIDRSALARGLGGELYGRPASHFIPPDLPGFAESGGDRGDPALVPPPAGDPARARKLLEGSGTAARRPVIDLGVSQVFKAVGEAVQAQLGEAGFRVRLHTFAPENTNAYCGRPASAPDACIHSFQSPGDPALFFGLTFSSAAITPAISTNFAYLRSRAVDAAIRAAKEAVGREARALAWAEANRRVLREVAAVPLVWSTRPVAHSRDVRGPALIDLHYPYVSLDQSGR